MDALRSVLRKYWGYDDFRPLQAEAMQSVVEGRDSVVVLPTGGGKSLCFQAPSLVVPGLAVVVSPLISLMKDQVDSLTDCGVPAACVNSTLSSAERREVAEGVRSGRLKLLYLSPERLMTERTMQFLKSVPLSLFAIDEAHCISDWGHDFRPEYRQLRLLKDHFPGVAIHAYTATATPVVREDIVRELRLDNPQVMVGSFDRPNLVYRVQRRSDLLRQIREVLERHPNDSGVIYCIRRADVENICATLCELGYQALPYHAGLDDRTRQRNQDAFINDRAKIIVATVAFGMGIDKSDVRYVIHAAAPRALENYQQESGRAGRDGLEAECFLFYSQGDFQTWRKLQSDLPKEAYEIALKLLAGMENFCSTVTCRHRAVMEYFGQQVEEENCGACDVCLSELDLLDDALVIAQKILSCVLRLQQRFGGEYTALVLAGSSEQRIVESGHDKLSTWGLLKEHGKRQIRHWIDQLSGQGYLRKAGEYGTLEVTEQGRLVLRGEVTPRLLKPADQPQRESRASQVSWEGVDRGLFEELRSLRRRKADEKGIPPFVVFSDATLRELARYRPSTPDGLLAIHGIGERKLNEYGDDFLHAIENYCDRTGVEMDILPPANRRRVRDERDDSVSQVTSSSSSTAKIRAFALFAEGKSLDEVQKQIGRAASTTSDYLIEHIEQQGICDPTHWLAPGVFEIVRQTAERVGFDRLKPIKEALGDAVTYEQIKIALACLRNEMPVE